MLKKDRVAQVLGKFFFEIVAVVAGISIAFLVDQWQQERKDRNEEAQLLRSIRNDIVNDSTALNQYLGMIDVHLATYQRILDKGWSKDSVIWEIDRLITYVAYRPIDLTFKELQQTGKSNLITNRQLLTHIINLNDRYIRLIDESITIDRQFVLERMIPYLETHARYPYDSQVDSQMLHDNQFKNLVKTNLTFKMIDKTILMAYKRSSKQLLLALNKELDSQQRP